MEGQEQVQDMGQLIGLLEVAAGEPGTRGKQIDQRDSLQLGVNEVRCRAQNFNIDVVITSYIDQCYTATEVLGQRRTRGGRLMKENEKDVPWRGTLTLFLSYDRHI